MRKLKEILYKVAIEGISGSTDVDVNLISIDSRNIKPGNMYVAIKGAKVDGHNFIDQSIDLGAQSIICEVLPKTLAEGVVFIKVDDAREALAWLAANFYDNPSSQLQLIGITGTNGKTSIAKLLFDLFKNKKLNAGLISTVAIQYSNREFKATHTTPDPLTINRHLSDMVEQGVEYCFMEVSSHAIDQKRTLGLKFKVGVFTNLSHDHLDYHKEFSKYRDVKKEFFDFLGKDAIAIVNFDDKNGPYMIQNCSSKSFSYSLKTNSNFSLKILEKDLNGMKLKINNHEIWTKLIGDFNAYNILATFSLAQILNFELEKTLNKISLLNGVDGRFEKTFENSKNQLGIIDYAHSPDSIEKVLKTLIDIKKKRSLITVIGCGGDRDIEKRPIMGKIVASLSDIVVLTSDNPRSENPKKIIEQMKKGICEKDMYKVNHIVDRKNAIKFACNVNGMDDVILVAGKGHEKFQIFGDSKIDFDDKKILECFLNKKN